MEPLTCAFMRHTDTQADVVPSTTLDNPELMQPVVDFAVFDLHGYGQIVTYEWRDGAGATPRRFGEFEVQGRLALPLRILAMSTDTVWLDAIERNRLP
jgi:hypothetical protein